METAVKFEAIVDQMKAGGYKEFKPNGIANPNASNAYQKRFRDEKGTKYFITCYEYDWSGIEGHGRAYHKSWKFDGQFELADGRSFNFETVGWFFHPTEWGHKVCTLEDAESFFEDMWVNMKCIHYESNEQ